MELRESVVRKMVHDESKGGLGFCIGFGLGLGYILGYSDSWFGGGCMQFNIITGICFRSVQHLPL